jgi:hypothetical protein
MDTLQRLWDVLGGRCELPAEEAQPDLPLAAVGLDAPTQLLEIDEDLQDWFQIESLGVSILLARTVGDLVILIEARSV